MFSHFNDSRGWATVSWQIGHRVSLRFSKCFVMQILQTETRKIGGFESILRREKMTLYIDANTHWSPSLNELNHCRDDIWIEYEQVEIRGEFCPSRIEEKRSRTRVVPISAQWRTHNVRENGAMQKKKTEKVEPSLFFLCMLASIKKKASGAGTSRSRRRRRWRREERKEKRKEKEQNTTRWERKRRRSWIFYYYYYCYNNIA